MPRAFDSTVREMEAQVTDLPAYVHYVNSLTLETVRPKEAVFCGTGDSLACAMFVERLMNLEPRAFDPSDVLLYPEIGQDKDVYFISVSGKTRSSIQAAKAARSRGPEEPNFFRNKELLDISNKMIY